MRFPSAMNAIRHAQFVVEGKQHDKHRIVLRYPAKGRRKGFVLISLVNETLMRPEGTPAFHDHTHHWETDCIVDTWRTMGYDVDAVRWTNEWFLPYRPYNLVIDARANLERFSEYLDPHCRKVMHIDTCHWKFHNDAQNGRLDAIEARRGIRLPTSKTLSPNRGIETADIATMLGNDFTAESYAFADTPIIRTPISTTDVWDWPSDKNWEEAKTRFLWFGSDGLVHKGLDLVLEAFAQMPDLHLTVCGPIHGELAFEEAYRKELYDTPNIETLGWIDIHSDDWIALAKRTGSVIYPSCSEGGGGSVITCMHAGMLPVVTRSASVDIEDFGMEIATGTVEETKAAAQRTAELTAEDIEQRTRAAWDYVRTHHTRASFKTSYESAAKQLIAG